MTPMEVMNDLAKLITRVVGDSTTAQPSGRRQVQVFAGYPPIPKNAAERASRIYALVTDFSDAEDEKYSTATVEIGFSVYDENEDYGWQTLFNLMERVRQALLKHRCLRGRTVLVLPLKGAISDNQPFPQWEGKITAAYQVGQPIEEGINYDEF